MRPVPVLRAILLGAVLTFPVWAFAQQASPPTDESATLELRHKGAPIVAPPALSPEAIGEAQKSVEDVERAERQERLLRETKPSPPRRPDLDYDVKSGIQGEAIQKVLPRK